MIICQSRQDCELCSLAVFQHFISFYDVDQEHNVFNGFQDIRNQVERHRNFFGLFLTVNDLNDPHDDLKNDTDVDYCEDILSLFG